MSSIQRSKSVPSVAPLRPFLTSHDGNNNASRTHRPRIVRHKTSLALTEMVTPRSTAGSGYQTPRAERIEDPFSLGGFFPPHLAGIDTPRAEWNWLRDEEMDVASELRPEHEEHRLEPRQDPVFDKAEDEETGRVIRREDKLGVLSLRSVFSSSEATFYSAYDDHVLTPYSDDLPEDSDALYQTYCDLRRAHTLKTTMADGAKKMEGPGLFSPVGDLLDEPELENEWWWSGIPAGLGKMLEMIPL